MHETSLDAKYVHFLRPARNMKTAHTNAHDHNSMRHEKSAFLLPTAQISLLLRLLQARSLCSNY
jgi:hypothetical protein